MNSQLDDIFLMLGDLAMFVLAHLSTFAVPMSLLITLLFWRDWKLLLHILVLLWLPLVVMSSTQQGVHIFDALYQSIASAAAIE